MSGLTSVAAIILGGFHTCARLTTGTVKCSGDKPFGEVGKGTTTNTKTPVVVSGVSGVVSASAGAFQACALLAGGTTKCWGRNLEGQLGYATIINKPSPTNVLGL